MSQTSDKVYGEPDSWTFDYPYDFLQTAFWMWFMGDFKRLPTQDEVYAYDPRYISDMRLMYHIYAHQSNHDPIMNMYDSWNAYHDDPDAFNLQKQQIAQSESYDAQNIK